MTPTYRHVACCVDGTDASLAALEEARRLAAPHGARLSVVCVDPAACIVLVSLEGGVWLPDAEEVAEGLRAWLREHTAGLQETDRVVVAGHPATAVCDWTTEARPDVMVVVETAGRVARLLLGSTSRDLVRRAPCPVLVVPRETARRRSHGAGASAPRAARAAA
jgi:nucleotide-binding universal stress UspA family protein